MGVRESLLNTITSVADSDFVRIVTSAGASSKATVKNLFKGFESNLSAKSSLTTSDYIRVVGSDNEAYKQSVSAVKTAMGVTTLENRFKYVSSGSFNDLQTYGMYLCQSLSNAPSTSYSSYSLCVFGDTTATKQVAYPTAAEGEFYTRHYVNGAWSAWVKMPTRAEMNTLSTKTQATVNTSAGIGGSCVYVKAGNMVTVSGNITVPSGTDKLTVLVSGLPAAASGNMGIRACNNNAVQSYYDMVITSSGGLRMSVNPTSNVDLRFTFAYVAA